MNAWDEDVRGVAFTESSGNNGIVGKTSHGVLENYLVSVGSRSSRLRRKYKERLLIIVLVVLLIVLLIVLIIISIFYSHERSKNVCQSKECVRSAATLLLSMDQSADPCEDFYQYTCGNWADEHPRPDYSSSQDWFGDKEAKVERKIRDMLSGDFSEDDPLPVVQAKDMYEACMDTEQLNSLGMRPVLEFMRNVSLPTIPTFFNLTKRYLNYEFDWITSIVKIKQKIAIDVLIGFTILTDTNNSTLKRLIFQEPSSGDLFPGYKEWEKMLKDVKRGRKKAQKTDDDPDKKEESEDEENDEDSEYMVAYIYLMTNAMQEVIDNVKDELDTNLTDEEIEKNVDCALKEYVKFYRTIYSRDNVTDQNSNDYEEKIVYYNVDELQTLSDNHLKKHNLSTIQIWKPYLLKMFNDTSVVLDFEKDVIMTSEADLEILMYTIMVVQNTSAVKLEMFVWMEIFENFVPHTTTMLRMMYDYYIRTVTGREATAPRSISCSNMVTNNMGMAVAYKLINKKDANQTLSRVKRMLSNIKRGFEQIIMTASWIDLTTKAATLVKVRNMKDLVGFPDWLFQPGELESFYEGMTTDPKRHIENILSLFELGIRNKLNGYRKGYKFDWDTTPTEVNAYHTFQANGITVPLVMLQYPFYDLGMEALNYGSVGSVLGHEITHGFDNTGRKYDKDGTLAQWWSNKTIEMFTNKTKCFVDQYSSFYVPEVDEYVNGKKTLGENIADNGGLKSAYLGYRMEKEGKMTLPGLPNLSGDQLFFLSFGNLWCKARSVKSLKYELEDEHSPSYLRSRGALQNMPEFAKAFNCRKNSTMNPSRPRCVIF